jgi:CMP/dCMP kinase
MGIVITVSRQLGAGGENIACKVAEELRVRVLGQEIIYEAMQAGIPEDITLESEASRRSWVQRALDFITMKQPTSTSTGSLMESDHAVISTGFPKSEEYYLSVLESIIFDLGQAGDVLLLGRAGQMMFRNSPSCFHIRIVAPLDKRIATMQRRLDVSIEEAQHRVEESDRARVDYLKRHYSADIDDANLYDLCINTGTLSEDTAASLIVEAIHAAGLR